MSTHTAPSADQGAGRPDPGGNIYHRRVSGLIPSPSPVRLWIDAHQLAPEGWYWVTTSQQALRLLKLAHAARLEIRECSLVHDLNTSGGAGATDTTDTTRPVVEWMCENNFFPRTLRVHCAGDTDSAGSANNAAKRRWLENTLGAHAPIGCLQRQ